MYITRNTLYNNLRLPCWEKRNSDLPHPPHRRSGWCESIMSRRPFVLFSLPKNEDQKNQWLKFIFTTIPEQFNKFLLLCSQHFTDDCFSNLGENKVGFSKRLAIKEGSLPTLFRPTSISESQREVWLWSYVFVFSRASYQYVALALYVNANTLFTVKLCAQFGYVRAYMSMKRLNDFVCFLFRFWLVLIGQNRCHGIYVL